MFSVIISNTWVFVIHIFLTNMQKQHKKENKQINKNKTKQTNKKKNKKKKKDPPDVGRTFF